MTSAVGNLVYFLSHAMSHHQSMCCGRAAEAALSPAAASSPQDDIHATAAYRRTAVAVAVERALAQAGAAHP